MSGGRTIVDFNHPLSGKDIRYEVNVVRKVTNDMDKAKSYTHLLLGEQVDLKDEGGKLTLSFPAKLPDQIQAHIAEGIKKHTAYKEINFEEKKKEHTHSSEKKVKAEQDSEGKQP